MSGSRRVAAAVVIAACASAPAPVVHGPSALVRADLARAEDAERARRHDLARAAYERAIADAHDPDSIDLARREYAETLETWGEERAAIVQLEAAVAARPDDAAAWHDLGVLSQRQHDEPRALAALARAKAAAPKSWKPRIALALVYWCHGDRAHARDEYRALLELELPERLRARVRWALDQLADASRAPLRCS